MRISTSLSAIAVSAVIAAPALAADTELNLYSSRHYDTDERLYSDFTDATGIVINRIEGNADELIARMQAEGANSPADVLITVDTSRLERARAAGILQPVDSEVLEDRIPAQFQEKDNLWFGFSQRARIIFYKKNTVSEPPQTYAALADPKYKGQICIRSGTNPYMQTILAAIIEHEGAKAAQDWAQAVKDNFARDPQGGDTDQLRGLVSGECGIAMSNTYYFARALRQPVDGVSDHLDVIGWVFPDQDGNGAHVNLSGAGMAAHAPHPAAAKLFLEYLASDQAQIYFSAGNDEYPAVEDVELAESVEKLGDFKADDVNLSAVAEHIGEAQMIFNAVGWK